MTNLMVMVMVMVGAVPVQQEPMVLSVLEPPLMDDSDSRNLPSQFSLLVLVLQTVFVLLPEL